MRCVRLVALKLVSQKGLGSEAGALTELSWSPPIWVHLRIK